MTQPKALTVSGKAFWAKVLPDQLHDNYNRDGKQWAIDVALDKESVATLKAAGLGSKIKNKSDDRGPFITFTRNELKKGGPKAGQPNTTIPIVTSDDEPYEGGRIGNGSLVTVEFNVFTVNLPNNKGTSLKPAILKIVVHELVEYVPQEREQSSFKTQPRKAGEETWEAA